MGYRDDALSRLDVAAFWQGQGFVLARLNDTEYRFKCPFHEDQHPSANVAVKGDKKGAWFCHVCNVGGSPIDLLMRMRSMSFKDALTAVGAASGMEPPRLNGQAGPAKVKPSKLSRKNVEEWNAAAKRNLELMRWFADKRGFTEETVDAFMLGWDGERVTIPVNDETGRLVNVRRYLRDSKGSQGKMIGIEAGANSARLFPLSLPLPDEVVLVEGEWDAILMHQMGFTNTLTVTSGAGIWPNGTEEWFKDRRVVIAYDNDDAGRTGAQRVARILSHFAQVYILLIPGLPDKGDVTDFFVEQNRSADELRSLILDATPYVVSEVAEQDEEDPQAVPLHAASDARFRGIRLSLPVLLSGKAMTPYTIPYEFEFVCPMNNKRYCDLCPMKEYVGHRLVRLSPKEPAVLSLVNVSTSAQYNALKELAGAVTQCNLGSVEVKTAINVEELRLIPELDQNQTGGEHEYVNRSGFFLGHGLMPNRSYSMIGYSHPHPKTQATVHLLSEAIPAQDNIGSFVMTPSLAEELRIFQPAAAGVEEKFLDIYDDLRTHVHRIQDRFDMQVAYDLTWHSVLDFYFNGAYTRRGWVETMVMGDSGQGKTEMAMSLLAHYGMGQRVQGEQTSSAGLIGGLEKLGDTWMLSWGRLPLNDKRLIVVDETQGLATEQVEGMSDVRATGVAEITKIRTERTNARCRIVWLANPVSGKTLSQHNQGVLAFSELFKKPEDIRRLDFGICVASGEVSDELVNAVYRGDAAPLRYTAALCRSLVLWAWSRRSDQVVFTPEATQAILDTATSMGRRYHPAIPLVEPADQRLKLARLSVAAAARTFSTDDGERVIVKPEHVRFVATYLQRVYNTAAMAYGEYSDQVRGGEVLEDVDSEAVREEIGRWLNRKEAVAFFRQARGFKKSDLIDVVGWDDAEAKKQLRFLAAKKCVRATREGYVKQPAFIALLRALSEDSELLLAAEDAPF